MSKGMHWHNPGPVRGPPGFIEPCLPALGRAVPAGQQWAYEIKHDGFRFICHRGRENGADRMSVAAFKSRFVG